MTELVKSVPVMLDRPRMLRFDLGAMVLFEKTTGKNALAIGNDLDAETILSLLWASLKSEDPALTMEAVSHMVSPLNIIMVEEKLAEAFQGAMPEAAPEGKTSSPQT